MDSNTLFRIWNADSSRMIENWLVNMLMDLSKVVCSSFPDILISLPSFQCGGYTGSFKLIRAQTFTIGLSLALSCWPSSSTSLLNLLKSKVSRNIQGMKIIRMKSRAFSHSSLNLRGGDRSHTVFLSSTQFQSFFLVLIWVTGKICERFERFFSFFFFTIWSNVILLLDYSMYYESITL